MEDGIPYAFDFMNPAPDADRHSVGQESFDWIVEKVAQLAVERARANTGTTPELRWASLLEGSPASAVETPSSDRATTKPGTAARKNTAAPKSKTAISPAKSFAIKASAKKSVRQTKPVK